MANEPKVLGDEFTYRNNAGVFHRFRRVERGLTPGVQFFHEPDGCWLNAAMEGVAAALVESERKNAELREENERLRVLMKDAACQIEAWQEEVLLQHDPADSLSMAEHMLNTAARMHRSALAAEPVKPRARCVCRFVWDDTCDEHETGCPAAEPVKPGEGDSVEREIAAQDAKEEREAPDGEWR